MAKSFTEIVSQMAESIKGVREALLGKEVREHIASGMESELDIYKQLNDAVTSAKNDAEKAEFAKNEIVRTIDPTLTLSGKAADAKATGVAVDKLEGKKADKTDLDTERKRIDVLNEGGLDLKDEVIDTSIKAWLADHPEATTTVQDGAITEQKINAGFLPYIKKDYVTPEMFGAVGDGVTDDYKALNMAINYASEHSILLFLMPNVSYGVSHGIKIEKYINIEGNCASIKALNDFDEAIVNYSVSPIYNGSGDGLHNRADLAYRHYINNVCINGNHLVNNGIKAGGYNVYWNGTRVEGCKEISVEFCGMVRFDGTVILSDPTQNSVGIYINMNDCYLVNTYIVDAHTALKISHYARIQNITSWILTKSNFENSVFVDMRQGAIGNNFTIENAYIDTYAIAVKATSKFQDIKLMNSRYQLNETQVATSDIDCDTWLFYADSSDDDISTWFQNSGFENSFLYGRTSRYTKLTNSKNGYTRLKLSTSNMYLHFDNLVKNLIYSIESTENITVNEFRASNVNGTTNVVLDIILNVPALTSDGWIEIGTLHGMMAPRKSINMVVPASKGSDFYGGKFVYANIEAYSGNFSIFVPNEPELRKNTELRVCGILNFENETLDYSSILGIEKDNT